MITKFKDWFVKVQCFFLGHDGKFSHGSNGMRHYNCQRCGKFYSVQNKEPK